MNSRLHKTALASGLMLVSSIAAAHPGHDHASWESPLIHTLFYAAIAAIGVAAVSRLVKVKRSQVMDADKGDSQK